MIMHTFIFRKWNDYLIGFGDLTSEFWLGLSVIQAMTMDHDHELLIVLQEHKGDILWAKYSIFNLGRRGEKKRNLDLFKLTARGHQGTAGNPLASFQGTTKSSARLMAVVNLSFKGEGGTV